MSPDPASLNGARNMSFIFPDSIVSRKLSISKISVYFRFSSQLDLYSFR